ncbi:MAG: SpoIIE family protein phosphatase [Bacilli bacterium]|nr:SpoIIE family protein phosphatase [Bacilli bacterium]
MKNIIKTLLVLLLSFLAIFYDKDGLNIIFSIPLLAFFMFNGMSYFLISLVGLFLGSYYTYITTDSYESFIFLLICLCIFFLIHYLWLLFNKKLIINYFASCLFSICITYLIYFISYDLFIFKDYLFIVILSIISVFLFSFLLKNFSFYLLSYHDEYSPTLLASLITLILSLSSFTSDSVEIKYISLFLILLSSIIFSIKGKTIHVLAYNSVLLLLSYLYTIPILYESMYLILPISVCISINKSKIKILNSLLVLACFIVVYFVTKVDNLLYFTIMGLSISFICLFIKKSKEKEIDKMYYRHYINNNKELMYQLENFQDMFLSLSESFKKARQNRILSKAKEEVFDTLCFNCPKVDECHKKGKHLLLNYVRDCLNDELDDGKINYIKRNCVKQEAYFTLLDKFTNTYLLNNYKKEEESRMKEIIAADFYSFSKIMEQCKSNIANDKLILATNFYQNIKEALKKYDFDVLFVNNYSNERKYFFDIAIKDIKRKEIKEVLMPIIDEVLQTNMEIRFIESATLSSSYYIIRIAEVDSLMIKFAYKQSNEDIKTCGDSVKSLFMGKHFFFGLADGMGNGMDANEESKFTLDTIMSMLKTNMNVKNSISITNDIIQLKNDFESYTTLDLLAIDRKKKIASFYKLGAFNTYIIRDHKVTEINNYALPLGIIENVYTNPSSYKISKGDVIIMCSDGMIDDTNKNIESTLEDISYDEPSTICNVLFNQLIEIRQNTDDATLAVITIN